MAMHLEFTMNTKAVAFGTQQWDLRVEHWFHVARPEDWKPVMDAFRVAFPLLREKNNVDSWRWGYLAGKYGKIHCEAAFYYNGKIIVKNLPGFNGIFDYEPVK